MCTAEGAIDVAVPQVRGAGEPFRFSFMGFLAGSSEMLERLVCEMYVRKLSIRDVEDAFHDATGELFTSTSAVSEITDRIWEDYQTCITPTCHRSASSTCLSTPSLRGLINAITMCFPVSIRSGARSPTGQHRAKLPDETAGEVMAHVYAVRDGPTVDAARTAAEPLINT